jgi:hypothetical protein
MTIPPRRKPGRERSLLDSPLLSVALVLVVVGVVAGILLVPGLLGTAVPAPSGGALSSSQPSATAPAGAPTFVRPTPSPLPTFSSHVVRSGETLTSIAKSLRTTARSLAWWNRGAYPTLDPQSAAYDPNHLQLGWILVALPGTVVDENNPPTPSPSPG